MRKERDSMGEMEVPDNALFGATTQRAVLNFPISDLRFQRSFIAALGTIKLAAARSNHALGLLGSKEFEAISKAASEVAEGRHDSHFVIDIFQTGSGTSTNMNANEVIANRAIEILGGELGSRSLVHPNDHVNMSQSSNDVIPTAMHIASYESIKNNLYPALQTLTKSLEGKSSQFANVIKSGRTHLQDATPITLGQEFGGYAAQISNSIKRLKRSEAAILELALGGTAVGTGLNTHPEFPAKAIAEIATITGSHYVEAGNHFEAQGSKDAIVEISGQLRTLACALLKIANDLRWLAAGPRCNLNEIFLPETQPGSSIMPAKVNPVICESVMMVAVQVMGNDNTVVLAGQHGNFELNAMMPIMAFNVLQSIDILATSCSNFATRCIDGIEANHEKCASYAEKSLATCTSLAPVIGYDKAAQLAKSAYKEDKTIRQAALDLKLLPEDKLADVLDLFRMTKPGL